MQVIIEGPDGSGKSTLIKAIQKQTSWPVVAGEGPEKHPGEMLVRIKRLLREETARQATRGKPRLYDRHSCISHPIYSQFTNKSKIPKEVTDQVYDLKHVIIYCQAPSNLELNENHLVKEHDTPEHLGTIKNCHDEIVMAYDEWALERAHIIYRYWEPGSLDRILRCIFPFTFDQEISDHA